MKKNTILIIGLGIPSELTDSLIRSGCDILRAEAPLQAAIALLRGDAEVVLSIGSTGEEWNDFTDVALASGKLVAVESLVAVPTVLASVNNDNGNGNGNGNGYANGNGANHEDAGLTVDEVVDIVVRRMSEPTGILDHIYTKVGNKLRKVPLNDILYIEVEGKYSALQVRDRKFNVKASLKDLLQKLPADRFVRVSRNFVVNLNRIQHIDTFQYTVKVGDMEIPISRTYKEELMRHINLI